MMTIRELSHPWDDWFAQLKPKSKNTKREDYPTIVLRKGVHYTCMSHSMTMQIRRQARLRGCRIHCQMREDGNALEIMLAKED